MCLAIIKKLRIVYESTLIVIFSHHREDMKFQSNPQEQANMQEEFQTNYIAKHA